MLVITIAAVLKPNHCIHFMFESAALRRLLPYVVVHGKTTNKRVGYLVLSVSFVPFWWALGILQAGIQLPVEQCLVC